MLFKLTVWWGSLPNGFEILAVLEKFLRVPSFLTKAKITLKYVVVFLLGLCPWRFACSSCVLFLINPFVKKCHEHFFKSFRIAKIDQLQNDVSFVLDKILHPEKVQEYFQTWKLTMIWKVNTCWPLVNKFSLHYLIYDNKRIFYEILTRDSERVLG